MNPLSLSMLIDSVSINEARECIVEDDEQSNTTDRFEEISKKKELYVCVHSTQTMIEM